MSTEATWQTRSTDSNATEKIAALIGSNLRGGETIELISDLAGGKTTFVRGLVLGVESTDKVASPTFTISRVYDTGKLKIYHFDFYRLHEAGMVAHELEEALSDPHNVVIVEWADIVQGVLPLERMAININTVGATERELTFVYPETMQYLLKGQKGVDTNN